MKTFSLTPTAVMKFEDQWVYGKQNSFTFDSKRIEQELIINVKKVKEEASHIFISYGEDLEVDVSADNTYIATIQGDTSDSLDVQLIVSGLVNGKSVLTEQIGLDISKTITFPKGTEKAKVKLRVSGSGQAKIREISLSAFSEELVEVEQAIYRNNQEAEYLILTNVYPEKNNLYRNMFVHRRAELYEQHNLNVDVFRLNVKEKALGYYHFENISVLTGGQKELTNVLNGKKYKKILIHFVNPHMMEAIEASHVKQTPILVWIHGVETEKWYRRWFNFTNDSSSLEKALASIKENKKRTDFMKSIYESTTLNIKFIFVSKWFKEAVAESDTNALVKNYSIIHNVVDDQLFNYVKKDSEQRKKILSIRPFASHKYANDLSVKAILSLSTKPYFDELEFNIYGQGALFDEILEPVRSFSNVHIHNYFLPQGEIANIHKEHGLFLCPTRLDAQGVSMCESMSSGLIPITNGVTAIPEFVNDDCGFLAAREDADGLAESIDYLYHHPKEFMRKSANAAKRMREQCSIHKIIDQELTEIMY